VCTTSQYILLASGSEGHQWLFSVKPIMAALISQERGQVAFGYFFPAFPPMGRWGQPQKSTREQVSVSRPAWHPLWCEGRLAGRGCEETQGPMSYRWQQGLCQAVIFLPHPSAQPEPSGSPSGKSISMERVSVVTGDTSHGTASC
jgi:hypothetical protein